MSLLHNTCTTSFRLHCYHRIVWSRSLNTSILSTIPARNRFAVIGLGNPGAAFVGTRHNTGFDAIDVLLQRHSPKTLRDCTDFSADRRTIANCQFWRFTTELDRGAAKRSIENETENNAETSERKQECALILVKPQTFMNRSGNGVRGIMDAFKIPRRNVLIIVDDVSLPLGKIRLRQRGSSGGQNGLESIARQLGTDKFDRLRVGVGATSSTVHVRRRDIVLGKFAQHEWNLYRQALAAAADCADLWLRDGALQAMNRFNSQDLTEELD